MAVDVVVTIWFWLEGEWVRIEDVLDDPPIVWEYGISDAGPLDLVASTGFLTFTLDNGTR